jgi:superfamily II DNA or RNA helicase
MENTNTIKLYEKYIFDIYSSLKNSGKTEFDNNDLCKIFEYYACIQLSNEYEKPFYIYEDIDPNFKEQHNMSHNDTGIDACNLTDTVVQCKLRKESLTWKECSTFFGSNISNVGGKLEVSWPYMMLARNNDSKLSANLAQKMDLFTDLTYCKKDMLEYCEKLYNSPPQIANITDTKIVLRDYQNDCVKLIKSSDKNVIINLPTGTGKGVIVINSMKKSKKYLIVVPTIILTEQLKGEFLKHQSTLKNKIQIIGGGNNIFDSKFDITICVNNSVKIVTDKFTDFEKIFIDEGHHILVPELYTDYDKNDIVDKVDETNETYIDTIKSLKQYNNNVYLSATIDENKDMLYYSKDIREMINLGHLCDYTINIPIFNDDPTNKNICEYLISRYRNVIIYCNSQKEGCEINILMNELLPNCSEYIDCNTTRVKRAKIIKNYKSGNLPFLVNVRVLAEGFDAPITKGVCFMHLPKSEDTIIQIVGRALRLHPEKKIANIILPYSTSDDEKSIGHFLKVMARNDKRVRRSYESRVLGGYINLVNVKSNDEDGNECEVSRDIELKYEMIYNSIGELQNGIEVWKSNLDECDGYANKNEKMPSGSSENIRIKYLGMWLYLQKQNYKNKEQIMKNDTVRKMWEQFLIKYKKYFLTSEDKWTNKINDVIKYVDKCKCMPSPTSKNKEIGTMVISSKRILYQTMLCVKN